MISPSETSKAFYPANRLRIETLRDTHIPQVMRIESVSFGAHHWTEESFFNEMRNHMGHYFALMDKQTGQLLGYCGHWVVLDESHITTVAVRPDCRGASLGEVLLIHLLENSRKEGARWATLEVRVGNYSAQNLYYKYAFESVGVRNKYYQDNQEDALIMTTPDFEAEPFARRVTENRKQLEAKLSGFPEVLKELF